MHQQVRWAEKQQRRQESGSYLASQQQATLDFGEAEQSDGSDVENKADKVKLTYFSIPFQQNMHFLKI